MKIINHHKKKKHYPGWVWMLFGLCIGLSLTFLIYLEENKSLKKIKSSNNSSVEIKNSENKELQSKLSQNQELFFENRFDFYEMLPAFEMTIVEEDSTPNIGVELTKINEPGVYLFQAGAFSTVPDANRRSAELKLHGINSHIQHAEINNKKYFRVYIGPIKDLEKINDLSEILWKAEIDYMRIKIGDR